MCLGSVLFFKFIVYPKERLCDKIYGGHEFGCLCVFLPLVPLTPFSYF